MTAQIVKFVNLAISVPCPCREPIDVAERSRVRRLLIEQADAAVPGAINQALGDHEICYGDVLPVRILIEIAFLDGLNYKDVGVTEKYWRYHFAGAIQFIKGQLGV